MCVGWRLCMRACVRVRIDDAKRRNAGDNDDAYAHTYCVYRFCRRRYCDCCCLRGNLLLGHSVIVVATAVEYRERHTHTHTIRKKQMQLHCDEDDGGDGFRMMLMPLCHSIERNERKRERRRGKDACVLSSSLKLKSVEHGSTEEGL
jgi:hypothetical protein